MLQKVLPRTARPLLALASLGALALTPPASAQAVEERPPNIVFNLMDDLGYSDVSIYGSDYTKRPTATV
jgi:hypothetical protein